MLFVPIHSSIHLYVYDKVETSRTILNHSSSAFLSLYVFILDQGHYYIVCAHSCFHFVPYPCLSERLFLVKGILYCLCLFTLPYISMFMIK